MATREDLLRRQYKDPSNLNARLRLHQLFSTNKYGVFRWIFDHVRVPANARILELGTGTALFWTVNRDRIPAGWQATVSDFSEGMLSAARARLRVVLHEFDFKILDAQEIPFPDGSFDAVVANFMLYHVPDIARALREIKRVLAPGASCYAATNGRDSMREFDDIVRRFIPNASVQRAASRFGLENGYDLMSEAFPRVELLRYDDHLVVTEAQPLIDYLKSTSIAATDEQIAAIRNFVDEQIRAHGAFHISKDAGLLIASKP